MLELPGRRERAEACLNLGDFSLTHARWSKQLAVNLALVLEVNEGVIALVPRRQAKHRSVVTVLLGEDVANQTVLQPIGRTFEQRTQIGYLFKCLQMLDLHFEPN